MDERVDMMRGERKEKRKESFFFFFFACGRVEQVLILGLAPAA